jgi:hypothetical protein
MSARCGIRFAFSRDRLESAECRPESGHDWCVSAVVEDTTEQAWRPARLLPGLCVGNGDKNHEVEPRRDPRPRETRGRGVHPCTLLGGGQRLFAQVTPSVRTVRRARR